MYALCENDFETFILNRKNWKYHSKSQNLYILETRYVVAKHYFGKIHKFYAQLPDCDAVVT